MSDDDHPTPWPQATGALPPNAVTPGMIRDALAKAMRGRPLGAMGVARASVALEWGVPTLSFEGHARDGRQWMCHVKRETSRIHPSAPEPIIEEPPKLSFEEALALRSTPFREFTEDLEVRAWGSRDLTKIAFFDALREHVDALARFGSCDARIAYTGATLQIGVDEPFSMEHADEVIGVVLEQVRALLSAIDSASHIVVDLA